MWRKQKHWVFWSTKKSHWHMDPMASQDGCWKKMLTFLLVQSVISWIVHTGKATSQHHGKKQLLLVKQQLLVAIPKCKLIQDINKHLRLISLTPTGADPEKNLTVANLNPGHSPGTFYKLRLLKTQFEQFRFLLYFEIFKFSDFHFCCPELASWLGLGVYLAKDIGNSHK